MAQSITGTASFEARSLQAERWRIELMAGCFGFALLGAVVRRAVGGGLVSTDAVFYPMVAICVLSLGGLGLGWLDTRRRERLGLALPWWRVMAGAVVDLAGVYAALWVLHLNAPAGDAAALSVPALLIVPLVIALSVLRLNPGLSVVLGVVAGLLHWLLVADTVRHHAQPGRELPQLLTYGVFLMVGGVVAGVMARVVRAYIREAAAEAAAAERAGRALSLLEHELDIAREIQEGLLPSDAPVLAGFDIAGMARPATHAGGDYFDYQALADGRLVVAIADVTGHGIGPALVMAVCRAYGRATTPSATSVESLLQRMNTLVLPDLGGMRFITMAVAVLGTDGRLDLVSAGHGPTFLYRAASGEVEEYAGDGLPLGISEGEQYATPLRTRLEPGDALIMMTDGFMERQNAQGEQFGVERLTAEIKRHIGRPAKELIAVVDAEVSGFAGGAAQQDDMTMVVLKRERATG